MCVWVCVCGKAMSMEIECSCCHFSTNDWLCLGCYWYGAENGSLKFRLIRKIVVHSSCLNTSRARRHWRFVSYFVVDILTSSYRAKLQFSIGIFGYDVDIHETLYKYNNMTKSNILDSMTIRCSECIEFVKGCSFRIIMCVKIKPCTRWNS